MLPDEIRSVQHPLVKEWVLLRTDRRTREEKRQVLIAGQTLCDEIPLELKLSTHEGYGDILVSDAVMKKITGLETPDGFAGIAKMPAPANLDQAKRIVILDRVADPGNLGTLIRTTLALGWDGVWLLPGTCDPFNDKALRAARGATFRLPLAPQTVDGLKQWGGHVLVADMHGEPVDQLKLTGPIGLVLSHEGQGANRSLGRPVSIPICHMDSLNVATAGAILLYLLRGVG